MLAARCNNSLLREELDASVCVCVGGSSRPPGTVLGRGSVENSENAPPSNTCGPDADFGPISIAPGAPRSLWSYVSKGNLGAGGTRVRGRSVFWNRDFRFAPGPAGNGPRRRRPRPRGLFLLAFVRFWKSEILKTSLPRTRVASERFSALFR